MLLDDYLPEFDRPPKLRDLEDVGPVDRGDLLAAFGGSKAIFNLAGGPHLYPPQNRVPHISILRCGHSRKRSAPTISIAETKRYSPSVSKASAAPVTGQR
jgi:hypothetical protein